MTFKIFHGDCLTVMKNAPDGCIDSIVTDPPYGMDFQSAWRPKAERFVKIANDKKPFIWFLLDAFRMLKDTGSIVVFSDWKNAEAWRLALDWAGFEVKSQVIWDRMIHGMGDLKASFAPQHDVIWFAVKKGGGFSFPGTRPKSVIASQRVVGDALLHPNEKPVPLMEKLILAVTPVGGTVLDPFMGSGATGVAALRNGFQFRGIELDENYFTLSQARLEKETV